MAKVEVKKSKAKSPKRRVRKKEIKFTQIEFPFKWQVTYQNFRELTAQAVVDRGYLVATMSCTTIQVEIKKLKAAIDIARAKSINVVADGKAIKNSLVTVVDHDNEELDLSSFRILLPIDYTDISGFSFNDMNATDWDSQNCFVTNEKAQSAIGFEADESNDVIVIDYHVLDELLKLIK